MEINIPKWLVFSIPFCFGAFFCFFFEIERGPAQRQIGFFCSEKCTKRKQKKKIRLRRATPTPHSKHRGKTSIKVTVSVPRRPKVTQKSKKSKNSAHAALHFYPYSFLCIFTQPFTPSPLRTPPSFHARYLTTNPDASSIYLRL